MSEVPFEPLRTLGRVRDVLLPVTGSPDEKISLSSRLGIAVVFYPTWVLLYQGVAWATEDRPLGTAATSLDALVPFVPAAVVPYALAYAQLVLCAVIIDRRETFLRLLAALSLVSFIAFAIYALFPTEAPPIPPLPDTLLGKLLTVQYSLDRRVNCFPSLHCATATLAALAMPNRPRWAKVAMVTFSVMVLASTVLVRQHWLMCIPAGTLLAWACWRVTQR